MENIVQVTGLTKNHAHLRALKGIDLTVGAGEIVGLVGENGAGKSTLISLLAGAARPDKGAMTLCGDNFAPQNEQDARSAGVGAVQQRFAMNGSLTVAEAIAGLGHGAQGERDEVLERAREVLRDAGVDLDPEAHISSLMRAEKALVEVLRVRMEDPQLVLMDEVAATFNDHEVATVHAITRQLARQGRGVIYITHRIDEVRSLADRVVVMREGAIKEEFVPREVGADQIVFSMLERALPERDRPGGHDHDDEALSVRGLSTDGGLSNVDLTLRRGEVLGLTGLRRAGMNELVGALVGVHPGQYEHLQVSGRDVSISSAQDAVELGIGYLSDSDDELNEAHEESVARMLRNDDPDPDAGFIREVTALREVVAQVKALHIKTHDIQGQVGKLSGGDQQKIALARWMSTDCDILILNHPTRGIDVGAKGDIYDMLTDLTSKGTSVLLISSEMSELLQWCHRILVMREGQIVSEQTNDQATEDTLMAAVTGQELPSHAVRKRHVADHAPAEAPAQD